MIELTIITTEAEGIDYKNHAHEYRLRKVVVNPNHIVCITEETFYKKQLELDLLYEGDQKILLDKKLINFSRITMDPNCGQENLIAIGTPSMIMEMINKPKRQLLKG